jgi:formate transporter
MSNTQPEAIMVEAKSATETMEHHCENDLTNIVPHDIENPSASIEDDTPHSSSSSRSHRRRLRKQASFSASGHRASTSVKTPKDTLQAVYKVGIYKAELPMHLLCIQSFMAGIYIAFAGQMFLTLNGGLLGAIFFPTGILAVMLTSAELFTGDALVFVASVLGNKVSIWSLLRNWTVAWIFNFAGCLVWASALGYASGALDAHKDFSVQVAMKKVSASWIQIFLKAIGANFLVCLAVWQSTCAEEAAGKILALWFPVASFVIMGFDHAIANQFLIPMGMMFGADISISKLVFHALLPATLGNIVGGGICIGAVYWFVFDSMDKGAYLLSRVRFYSRPSSPENSVDDVDTEAVNGDSNTNKSD